MVQQEKEQQINGKRFCEIQDRKWNRNKSSRAEICKSRRTKKNDGRRDKWQKESTLVGGGKGGKKRRVEGDE